MKSAGTMAVEAQSPHLAQTPWVLAARSRALRTIARDTVLEALRGRWFWLAAAATLFVGAAGAFARSLALTETHDVTVAFAAPLSRLAGVLIVVLTTVASMVREKSEGTLLLALAAPVSRASWLAGKALGFALIATTTALLLALPVLAAAPALASAAWTLSLALELILVATVSMAIGRALGQIALAVSAAIAFYVLARLLHVVLLLAERAQNYSELESLTPLVHLLRIVVPRLDLFTCTDWLLYSPPSWANLGAVGLQWLLYTALALVAAVIDLRRAPLA
ncbi:MAG TPA: ABC transporter permease [Burkholderiaceae bacterium]|nr:ABC transporter permease [Burkholderiaceae bacterium]